MMFLIMFSVLCLNLINLGLIWDDSEILGSGIKGMGGSEYKNRGFIGRTGFQKDEETIRKKVCVLHGGKVKHIFQLQNFYEN